MARPEITELIVDDPRLGSRYRTGTMTVDGRRYDFETNPMQSVRLWIHLRPFVKRRLPHGARPDLQAIALRGIAEVDRNG